MCEHYLVHIITATSMCNFYHIINIAMPLLQGSYCYYCCGVLIAATVCNADVSVCKCYNDCTKVDILPLLWYKGYYHSVEMLLLLLVNVAISV